MDISILHFHVSVSLGKFFFQKIKIIIQINSLTIHFFKYRNVLICFNIENLNLALCPVIGEWTVIYIARTHMACFAKQQNKKKITFWN